MIFSSSLVYSDALSVSRIAGKDRYATDVLVNQFIFKEGKDSAVLTSGSNFKSALNGSYMASTLYLPFFITPENKLNPEVLKQMQALGVKNIYLLGTSLEKELLAKGFKVRKVTPESLDLELWRKDFNAPLKNYFPGDIGRCIFVNDEKFPDLLSMIPFAARGYHQYHTMIAPLELSERDYDKYGNELYDSFSLIGGYNSIPKRYFTEYHTGKMAPLNRIAGRDRYETAVKIAKANDLAFKKKLSKTVVLVNGENYPDALSSGIVAMYYNAPVLLTQKDSLNESTKKYLKDKGIEKVVLIGGENSVGEKVVKELRESF